MSDRTWYQELWIKLCRWVAYRLPHDVIYFAALRLGDHAAPTYNQQAAVTLFEAMGRWNWSDEAVERYYNPEGRS